MRNAGECEIEGSSPSNIPVNIFLTKPDENLEGDETHMLTADNFMPRRCTVSDGAYVVYGTEEELREAVKKYVMPLYQAALDNVTEIVSKARNSHYYWEKE